MNAARALGWARRRAGLSQRALAAQSGVPQSTIGRIEAGLVDPRVRTLSRLLRAEICVEAGVDSVDHGHDLDEEQATRMKERGV